MFVSSLQIGEDDETQADPEEELEKLKDEDNPQELS
jgi:hypothetical protein